MQKGIAEQLEIKDLSSSSLTEKIEQLLSNEKYKNNIRIVSKAFRDQKDTPLERGLWWIEWALRNPNATHFKSSGADLNFVQIQSIDVIVFLTLVLISLTFFLVVVLKRLWRIILKTIGSENRKNKVD